MKAPILLLILLSLWGCTSAEAQLYMFQEKGLRGYMDGQGKVVLPAVYRQATEFSEGLAAVRIGDKMGYINPQGKTVIAPQWDMAGPFSQGLAPILTGGKFGFIDRTGTVVIPAEFRTFTPFRDGFSVVSVEDAASGAELFGLIDVKGKFVMSPEYQVLNLGDLGYALGVKTEKGILYKNGLPVGNEEYIFAFPHQEGLALVSREPGDLRYIDQEGKTVIDLLKGVTLPEGGRIYMSLGFREGMAVTGIASASGEVLYGALDTSGIWKIQPTYAGLGSFEGGLAPVLVNGLYGFLDKDEGLVIPPQFNSVENFRGEVAKAVLKGRTVYINRAGEVIKDGE